MVSWITTFQTNNNFISNSFEAFHHLLGEKDIKPYNFGLLYIFLP